IGDDEVAQTCDRRGHRRWSAFKSVRRTASADRHRGMGQRQTPGTARAQARDDRSERDGAAGDGFHQTTCTNERRPRCARSVAKVLNLVTQARGKGAFIVYSVAVPGSVPTDILPELTPAAGEPVLPPLGPDKFIGSELEKTLKDKGIKTVVAMGTQAQTS